MAFTNDQIEDIKKIATDQLDAIIPNHLPIGTIISSLINYDKFRDIVNDPLGFQKDKTKWSPADGRKVDGSKYASYLQVDKIPDLRGLFIRGLNKFDENEITQVSQHQRDPESRVVGSYQKDEFDSHSHEARMSRHYGPNKNSMIAMNGGSGGDNISHNESGIIDTSKTGGSETRPKNVAVYYYIKIN